jgi:hypothetical protein
MRAEWLFLEYVTNVAISLVNILFSSCVYYYLTVLLLIMVLIWYMYQHPKVEYYKRSKKSVQLMNTTLQCHFVQIFYHFYKIQETERVSPNEGCTGQSPFIGISITHDYYCNIHSDTNDFSYNFFVWLSTDGKSNIDIQFILFILFMLCSFKLL